MHLFAEGFVSQVAQELPTDFKTEKWAKHLNRHFTQEETHMARKEQVRWSTSFCPGNAKRWQRKSQWWAAWGVLPQRLCPEFTPGQDPRSGVRRAGRGGSSLWARRQDGACSVVQE